MSLLNFRSGSLSDKFRAVIIYCPPYSEVHSVTSNTFCTDGNCEVCGVHPSKEKLAIIREI